MPTILVIFSSCGNSIISAHRPDLWSPSKQYPRDRQQQDRDTRQQTCGFPNPDSLVHLIDEQWKCRTECITSEGGGSHCRSGRERLVCVENVKKAAHEDTIIAPTKWHRCRNGSHSVHFFPSGPTKPEQPDRYTEAAHHSCVQAMLRSDDTFPAFTLRCCDLWLVGESIEEDVCDGA